MELIELQSNIKQNNINPFYIFSGYEIGVMNVYIRKIAELRKLKIKRIEEYETIKQSLKMKSLLGENYLYVIYNDKKATGGDIDKIKSGDIVIFRYDKIDNRKTFFIKYENETVYFNNMHEDVLLMYCQKYFSKKMVKYQKQLIQFCNKDYERIMSEINKITNLADILKISKDEALKRMLSERLIYKKPEDVIFSLVDSLMERDEINSYSLLKEALDGGEYILAIIKVLIVNIYALLSYKGTKMNIQKNTDLNYYQIKKCEQWTTVWKVKHLLKVLDVIRNVEIGIKTGKIEDNQGINLILTEILL